jgi:TRAP-type C4-dicarboxylate transport system substrate-binding protein
MKRTIFAAAGALALAGFAAQAQDKPVTLKFSYWVPPKHSLVVSSHGWAESLAKATNGTLKVQIYPSNQLGKGPDHYDMAKDGIADLVLVNPGYTPGRFPVIAAAEMPFLTNGAVNGSPGFQEWYRGKYAPREMKEVWTCLVFTHEPGTFHMRNKKIEVPDDVKGLKIRTGNATSSRLIGMLGGSSVAVEITEARETLSRGIVDGIMMPWEGLTVFRIGDVTKFHMENPLYVSIFTWNVNRKAYDSLSATQKKALEDHCSLDWTKKIVAAWAARDHDAISKFKPMPDHVPYKISSQQVEQWRKASEPLRKQWADEVNKAGYKADEVWNELIAALKKHNGLYQ